MPEKTPAKPNQAVILLAFVLGLTSIIGQIILLRELVAVFYGNETVYAIVLASWLFWIAAGSFMTSRLSAKIRNPAFLLGLLLGLIYFILPFSVAAIRLIKQIMNVPVGEMMGSIPMGIAGFLLLAPLTIILGSIFTTLCRFSESTGCEGPNVSAAGTIYLWEAVGATAGGLLLSFLLIPLMSAMQIIFAVGLINIGAMIFLPRPRNKFSWVGLFLLACTLIGYSTGLVNAFDRFTRRMQWKGFEVVSVVDSVYGNITLTKMKDEYSLFENGLLSYSTRDELTSEENTHYALLEHPHPQNILLIGNGIGGNLKEILKHPVARIDYVELDPAVIRVSERYLPQENLAPLRDTRVRVIYTDARLFVKGRPFGPPPRLLHSARMRWGTASVPHPAKGGVVPEAVKEAGRKYDIVIVNLGDPYTALINRYYSLEFFREADRILNPEGILALSVSAGEDYLSPEAKTFLRSIHTTLRQVFVDIKSIPGETNIFLACKNNHTLTYDVGTLIDRLKNRNIKTQFVNAYYLPAKLTEDRVAYIEGVLKEDGPLNTDMHPVVYFYDIVLWSTHFNMVFKQAMEKIAWIKLEHLMTLPVILLAVGWFLRKRFTASPVVISVVSTGLSEIIFQLVVILAFQTLYGYVYYKVGLIMSSFMAGLALGSFAARRIIAKRTIGTGKIYRIYQWTQLGISAYPLLLPAIFIIFGNPSHVRYTGLFAGTFAFLPIVAGFIGGLQYPLATHLLSCFDKNKKRSTSNFAGDLYAADTWGAAAGALVTGTILIPLVGIPALAFLCAAFNAVVLLLLLVTPYPANLSARV